MPDWALSMDGAQLFRRALEQASAVVSRVGAADLGLPTPCTEWDVRALAAHMLYEVSWVPDIVAGATIAEVGDRHGGDLMGGDLRGSWRRAADAALAAAARCDPAATAHLSYGDVTNDDYLRQQGADQLIHAWDLGVATGIAVRFDPEVAAAVHADTLPHLEGMRASGLFAPPHPVPEGADIQARVIALFGRDPGWSRPG